MNWNEWIERNQYNVDFGNDSIDLMKQAYIGGLKEALEAILHVEDGDYDFIIHKLENLIKESES